MPHRDRRLAILASLAYLAVGVAAWAVGPAGSTGPVPTTSSTMPALWAAAAILVILAHLDLASRGLDWLVPAVVGPIALYPLTFVPGAAPTIILAVLWPLSAVPLGLVLASGAPWHARRLLVAVQIATGVAVLAGLVPRLVPGAGDALVDPIRSLAVLAIVAVPALARMAMADVRDRARPTTTARDDVVPLPAQINERLTLIVAAAGPALAGTILVTDWEVGLASVLVATVVLVVASRVAIRPLAWLAAQAAAQRDLAIAAGEAERTRLAADLHDGPLQDVLLLARRLDDAGDPDGASMARAIGDDLRDLSADLRLPLLDDLGVGPALEWLGGRVRRMTAIDVRVEYTAVGRPPADVELAAFRIAQEALANAVRHGAPPILIRCSTAARGLSMTIQDAGIEVRSPVLRDTTTEGGFGLGNMQGRADRVGARLEWRRPREGGTRIELVWPAAGGVPA